MCPPPPKKNQNKNQTQVINAPGYFQVPWKLAGTFLDPNTRAKVSVVCDPRDALPQLEAALGGRARVPKAWGGDCDVPLEFYPANVAMLEYVAQLNAGTVPDNAPARLKALVA